MSNDSKKPDQADSIDENLRRAYGELVEEDLPERFKNLLEQLKQQDTSSAEAGGAE